jgi:hypothetical protein
LEENPVFLEKKSVWISRVTLELLSVPDRGGSMPEQQPDLISRKRYRLKDRTMERSKAPQGKTMDSDRATQPQIDETKAKNNAAP